MATINQDPAGQASVTLSGISFNSITATASPVHTGSRFTVLGGSFAVNLGGTTSIVTEALIAGMVSVINPLGATEITTSPNLPPSVVNLDEENLVAVADDDSPSLTIFGATLP